MGVRRQVFPSQCMHPRRSALRLEPLEPRLLLSAAPLSDVTAWVESGAGRATAYMKVYDPVLDQWVQDSESFDTISGFTNRDGVVAWIGGVDYGMGWDYYAMHAVYDPALHKWQQEGHYAESISGMTTRDGVVAWKVREDFGEFLYVVHVATYDPASADWTMTWGGYADSIQRLTVGDGVAAWVNVSTFGFTTYDVACTIYDPQAGAWEDTGFYYGDSSPSLSISAGTVTASGAWGTETRGYDPADTSWHADQQTQPLAWFEAVPQYGDAPLDVWFWDMSIGATGWSWDFDDGGTSTDASPHHTFTGSDVYTVTLDITGPEGADQATADVNTANPPEVSVFVDTTEILDGQGATVDFGTVEEGEAGIELIFTVRNDGGAPGLTLGSITVPDGFTLVQDFTKDVLAGGEEDTFTVRLDSDLIGHKAGEISFVNGDQIENPFNFPVSGWVATATPEVAVFLGESEIANGQTTPVDFGASEGGHAGQELTFTVANYGLQNLALGSIELPTGYTLVEPLVAELAPTSSDTFTVRLDTDAGGTKAGDIQFTTNDTDENPFSFPVVGTITLYGWTGTCGGVALPGHASYEHGTGIAIDSAGDLYLTGYFEGTATDLDPSAGVERYDSNGWCDVFVIKLDGDRQHLWTRTFGGSSTDYGRAIAIDGFDNLYIVGTFRETVDFDPTGGTDPHSCTGREDSFITKLDSDGEYLWTRTIGGSGGSGWVQTNSVATDTSGNVYITGYFTTTVDLDPTDGADTRSSAGGGKDIFITKLLADGSYGWTVTYGGTTGNSSVYEQGVDIAVSSDGDVFVTGTFSNTIDFDPTAGVDEHSPIGYFDPFITRLNSDGTYGWTRTFELPMHYFHYAGPSVALDGQGDVLLGGQFQGTVDFDPTEGTDVRSATSGYDTFVTKLQGDGSYAWTWTAEAAAAYSVAIGPGDSVVTTGDGILAARLDPEGNEIASALFDAEYSPPEGHDIALDAAGNAFVVSLFSSTRDFDPTQGTDERTALGAGDIAVTKLKASFFEPRPEVQVTDDEGSATDLAIDFGEVSAQGGAQQYQVTVTNAGGLDLEVQAATLSDATHFALSWPDGAPTALAPDASTVLTVTFDPAAGGSHDATLTIESDDPFAPILDVALSGEGTVPEIALEGFGYDIPSGDASPSTDDGTDFGVLDVDGGTGSRSFTIRNTGTGDLSLTGDPRVEILGADADDFTVIVPPAATVAATTAFSVAFDPSGPGLRAATVSIANDDADENPFTFDIQGWGNQPFDLPATLYLDSNDLLAEVPPANDSTHTRDFRLGATASWEYELQGDISENGCLVGLWLVNYIQEPYDPTPVDVTFDVDLTIERIQGGTLALGSDEATVAEGQLELVPFEFSWDDVVTVPGDKLVLDVTVDGDDWGGVFMTQQGTANYSTVEFVAVPPGCQKVGTIQVGDATVHVYDTDGTIDVDLADIQVKPGKGGSIKSITLRGEQAMGGVGIIVSGATSVGTFKDAREGDLGDLAFIGIDAPAKTLKLKSGLTGCNLNGAAMGGVAFPADLDGDGDTDDATGLWVNGDLRSATLFGDLAADAVIDGDLAKLVGRANVDAGVDVVVAGLLGKIDVVGAFAADLTVSPAAVARYALAKATIRGAVTGGTWTIDGPAGKILSKGDFAADLDALSVKSLAVGGNLDGAAIDLTLAAAPKLWALAKLKVTGWIRNTVLTSTGHLGTLTAGGLDGTTILADVPGGDLPDDAGDFASQCRLKSLNVKGIKAGKVYVDSFIDSRVAAWTLGKARIREVDTTNLGETFGLAFCEFGSIKWKQEGARYRWPAPWSAAPGDLDIRDFA